MLAQACVLLYRYQLTVVATHCACFTSKLNPSTFVANVYNIHSCSLGSARYHIQYSIQHTAHSSAARLVTVLFGAALFRLCSVLLKGKVKLWIRGYNSLYHGVYNSVNEMNDVNKHHKPIFSCYWAYSCICQRVQCVSGIFEIRVKFERPVLFLNCFSAVFFLVRQVNWFKERKKPKQPSNKKSSKFTHQLQNRHTKKNYIINFCLVHFAI